MYNRNNQSQSHSTGVRNAGFQNKQFNFYKQGVQRIYGIPYTAEEQNTLISWDQIKNTIITLCREQRRNPDFSAYKKKLNQFRSADGMYLPDANELIAHSVSISERIQSH